MATAAAYSMADQQPKPITWSIGRRPPSAVMHLSNEPAELLQRLCRDDSTINIVMFITMNLCIHTAKCDGACRYTSTKAYITIAVRLRYDYTTIPRRVRLRRK